MADDDNYDAPSDVSTTIPAVRPFEWLTDASSLDPIVKSALNEIFCAKHGDVTPKTRLRVLRVLHVGCGSSILGEHLLTCNAFSDQIEEVVNVDNDLETLNRMEKRWKEAHSASEKMLSRRLQFRCVDFSQLDQSEIVPYPSGYFDLAIDKSTLDCTLCNDAASAGLISEIYRLLNPQWGVYICISFHHVDFLQPLLQNCPGTEWEVTHSVMARQIEDLIGKNSQSTNHNGNTTHSNMMTCLPQPELVGRTAWASGSFEPDDNYRRTVNVMMSRRRDAADQENKIDRRAVVEHINHTNDFWFREQNPMLTTKRKEDIQQFFVQHGGNALYDLNTCYSILFTEAEREHLPFDFFMEDWNAYLEKHGGDGPLPRDRMSVETALAFLEEMQ